MTDRGPNRAGGLSWALFGKSMVIALLAGLIPWLVFWMFLAPDNVLGWDGPFGVSFAVLPIGLLGSFAVGLPIALMTYALAGTVMAQRPIAVFMAANLAAAVMALVLAVLGGPKVVWLYGIPCAIAANTYALLGWQWILKPLRAELVGTTRTSHE